MEYFTPGAALAGGALVGLGAAMLLWLNGRIAGVSGIFAGTLGPRSGDVAWRALFLLGLVGGAWIFVALSPAGYAPRTGYPATLLALGGFLVGFGTRLSGGCTSGHGVCGVARLSPRSIVATATFVTAGALTVFLVRHVVGFAP